MSTRRAMVTGASEGIGRAFATKLAANDYSLTLVARNEARLKDLVSTLPGSGHVTLAADLATEAGVTAAAEKMGSEHYQLLVNNAGSGNFGRYTDVEWQKHSTMLQLNCVALAQLAYAFLKTAVSGDTLLNVSSALAFMPMPGSALYAASKAFVTSLSDSLWFESKQRDVYVVGLCPGMTTTEFGKRAGADVATQPPAMLVQTAEQVANIAYEAVCARKEPMVMCGEINQLVTGVTRLLPRKAVVSMMGSRFN